MGLLRELLAHRVFSFGLVFLLSFALFLFGAKTSFLTLIFALVILMWVVFGALFLGLGKPGSFVSILLVAWLGFVALSYLKGSFENSEEQYLMILAAIGVFWGGQTVAKDPRAIKLVWNLLLLQGLLFSFYALVQHVFTPDQIYFFPKKYHLGRLTGSFISSNSAATYLGIIVLASTASCIRTYRKFDSRNSVDQYKTPVFAIVTLLFSLTALFLTASRAGLAALGLTLLMFFVWFLSKSFRRYPQSIRRDLATFEGVSVKGVAVLIAMGGVLCLFFGGAAFDRYKGLLSDTAQRRDIALACWETFKLRPFFGHGLGRFNEAKLLGADEGTLESVLLVDAAHNFYLQTLVQTGLAGLIFIILVFLYPTLSIIRGIRRGRSHSTYMMAVLMIGLFVALHGLFDYGLEVPVILLTCSWLIGIMHGLATK